MIQPKHVVVVGALVRNADSRILLIRHHRRGWEIPQGRVEEGEGLLEALHREVREESGVEITPGPLAAVFSKTSPPAAVIFSFIADYRSGTLRPSEETPELAWFSPQAALAQVSHPVNHHRLATLLTFDGHTLFSAYSTNPFTVQGETGL
ncbi:8-oxo-dGTP diphosphatase [Geoalkalibacter ferrihydriticus]|uniref:NUDIX hydrolase n=2 Tax=Geoalkalibacter ferrihydriticus TaxID=392333 RepID=A0A0C2EH25_9BACT|nr:NUDIX hydrolase [Geoalkalibacter ferrihydriticus]KIH77968.1 NUDIX hydrolase [Geoalkalibacter ferrihydriticus DSM 17813]SDM34834.1 8-oxo-dGTP diphosphatase [Geoalkalibacter ferrihydriticus]